MRRENANLRKANGQLQHVKDLAASLGVKCEAGMWHFESEVNSALQRRLAVVTKNTLIQTDRMRATLDGFRDTVKCVLEDVRGTE